MKLQVTQENLAKALSSVAKIASGRNTLPILSNVLIKTVGTRLSISATNLDVAITHILGAKISSEGAITVPARLAQDFITSLPAGVIDLELEDYKLHISTDKYKSTINGVPADEFPVMPAIAKGQSLKIAAKDLKKSLQQVIIAASNDQSRPVLTGINIYTLNNQLYMVATDSYRLAEKVLSANFKDKVGLLVPASAMQELLRIMSDQDEEVEVHHDDQQVLFKTGDVELVARLIEGQYPDYRKLIPQKFNISASLKRADFLNVTKVSSLFARESAGSVTIDIDEKSKQLGIKAIASQIGENSAVAEAKVTGSGQITLNSRYLLDGLQVMDGEDISFGFNGKLEPSIIKDSKASDYLHVIMPLKS